MKNIKSTAAETKKTDLETAGLKGHVKQVMQTVYKAHQKAGVVFQGKIEGSYSSGSKNSITTYNVRGAKTQEKYFGTNGMEIHHYSEQGILMETLSYDIKGVLGHRIILTYNEQGALREYEYRKGDGSLFSKTIHNYRDDGKPLSQYTYKGNEEVLSEYYLREYDERGNQTSCISYNADNSIKHYAYFKFNDQNKQTEYTSGYTDKKMAVHYVRHVTKYNAQGDSIETISYNEDGSVKDVYTTNRQYDDDGKLIVPPRIPYNPDALKPGETEEFEKDARDNWIKRTTFYNKIPKNIFVRKIIYFDEPAEVAELVHPITVADVEEIQENSFAPEELTEEQVKWLAEGSSNVSDNFSFLRYYALKFGEPASVINYSGPHIEAVTLLKYLKENHKAQEVHSYSTIWDGHSEQPVRYTVTFPAYPYMLSATQIVSNNEEYFDVPDNIENRFSNYLDFSPIVLLRPSEASGKRDQYFEEQVDEYIQLCSVSKKPDKPVINMIEVRGNNFAMVEHPVDDDFEIKDLDVNYGYGFEKFHDQLMERFNSSTKGLVLFHGEPGTGKTFYIRHLLRTMVSNRKVVIYMPPNMVDHLVEPAFMTFLAGEVKDWSNDGYFCVLLIEDAEPLLAKRQEGVRIQGVTNLLNMTDGLLNDMLNLQIICTFNVDLKKLDSALLRPGRLIARKEFKALGELDANLLAQRLGIKHHFKKPATLGEIYSMRKNKNTLIHDVEHDRDASTAIDDL